MVIIWNTDHFQRNLAYQRRMQKLSRRELARRVGVSALTLKQLESGQLREADSRLILRLLREFEMEQMQPFSQYLSSSEI